MGDDGGFHHLMGRLDHAMLVVTTAAGDARAGCLVGFHSQCSVHPARYAIWVSKANHTCRVGLLADVFALHVLRQEDRRLAELFGTLSGDSVDKFARCRWHPGPEGVPLLDECPNRVVARRSALFDDGSDHVCFVVEPVHTEWSDEGHPLGFLDIADLDPGHDVDERQRPG